MKRIITIIAFCLLIPASVVYGLSTFTSVQVGSSPVGGRILQTNGSISTWVATSSLGISSTPAGSSGQIQYNDNGSFGATSSPFIDGSIRATGTIGSLTHYLFNGTGLSFQSGESTDSDTIVQLSPNGTSDIDTLYFTGSDAGFDLNWHDALSTTVKVPNWSGMMLVGSSTSLYVSSTTGNVGIGTVSPETTLQVTGSGITIRNAAEQVTDLLKIERYDGSTLFSISDDTESIYAPSGTVNIGTNDIVANSFSGDGSQLTNLSLNNIDPSSGFTSGLKVTGSAPVVGTGTATEPGEDGHLVGTNTLFTTEVSVGDYIYFEDFGKGADVVSVESDTALTLNTALGMSEGSYSFTVQKPIFTALTSDASLGLNIDGTGMVGTTMTPQNALDVRFSGSNGTMFKGTYEAASVERNGDTKFGIYSSASTLAGASASLMLGTSAATDNAGGYPGFEFQAIPGATPATSYVRFNWVRRNSGGAVEGSQINILDVMGDGKVGINTNAPLSTLGVNGGTAIGTYSTSNAAPSNGLIVSGRVGIGTTTPAVSLDVNGGYRGAVTSTSTGFTCNSSLEGTSVYNLSNHHLWLCMGSEPWTLLK